MSAPAIRNSKMNRKCMFVCQFTSLVEQTFWAKQYVRRCESRLDCQATMGAAGSPSANTFDATSGKLQQQQVTRSRVFSTQVNLDRRCCFRLRRVISYKCWMDQLRTPSVSPGASGARYNTCVWEEAAVLASNALLCRRCCEIS